MGNSRTTRFHRAAWLVLTYALCVASGAHGQTQSERDLEAVRSKILTLEGKLVREHADRDANGKALAAAEQRLAAAHSELARLRTQRAGALERQRALTAEMHAVRARLGKQRAVLAEQLRLSFALGREPFAKLLLSQQDPARLGRMLVYYEYFNDARTEQISAASAELGELAALAAESATVAERLTALEQAQQAQVETLASARAERAQVLERLEQTIAATGSEIDRLHAEEQRLETLIDELSVGLEDFPVSADEPFASLKGKLAWPVPGRLVGDFGAPRAGGVHWNGVLLEAAAGTPVRAIYHGRVAFADWLPGLGLLLIVDHGGGYMSLYGHNETLLKDSGDWVEPGEIVGQVGDTGGQASTALYFEIRRNGRPVDPHPWMKAVPDKR